MALKQALRLEDSAISSGVQPPGEVERLEHAFLFDLVAFEEFVGGCAFAADPLLFLGEEVLADLVGVVGLQEFAFFVVESGDFGSCAGGLALRDFGERVDVRLELRSPWKVIASMAAMPASASFPFAFATAGRSTSRRRFRLLGRRSRVPRFGGRSCLA